MNFENTFKYLYKYTFWIRDSNYQVITNQQYGSVYIKSNQIDSTYFLIWWEL